MQGENCTALGGTANFTPGREDAQGMPGTKQVPGLHIPSPGRDKGLLHVQSKAGCFFLSTDFTHSMFSEAGLIWGRWRVVLSAGDMKTSTPSDWIAPLRQVLWAELLSLCFNLSTSNTPKFIFQFCDWNGYKWKC